jgi:flagellar hook-associated protein FlgK
MAKALLGTMTTPRTIELLDEIRALRRRVAELETALATAEAVRDARDELPVDLSEVVELEEPVTA